MKHPLTQANVERASAHIHEEGLSPAERMKAHFEALVEFFEPADDDERCPLMTISVYDALRAAGVSAERIEDNVHAHAGEIAIVVHPSRPDGVPVSFAFFGSPPLVWDISAALNN